ncbi:hypothetical protein OKJ48_33010 [Streptomyces kunmingensis]|uniref:Uncharacterized protein n=1 Tax=Streptomyces kunmingensis TaxID=68225 RepID=A0ABU6CKQ4_9ACTN|nr:hypothetical protein [Streptomyces kunmingensis]MEB3965014.1 hypothetical protein [Streptomyces kunmingensis]
MSENVDGPARAHQRPAGVSDATVEALGSVSKALETVEQARGHLYALHRLTGTADLELGRAVGLLRDAGHEEWAERIDRELVGRNVLEGRWTFQIVEEYNATFYEPYKDLERQARDDLVQGRDHLYEAEMKEARRTKGHPDHVARPAGEG